MALHRECSGCSLVGARAVLDVVRNRQKIDNKTACQVIQSSAFPWSKKQKHWKPSPEMTLRYHKVERIKPVLKGDVYYFNNKKFTTFGRFCCKIGSHFFYYMV